MKKVRRNRVSPLAHAPVAAGLIALLLAPAAPQAQALPRPAKPLAKNVIVLISDGMGYQAMQAANLFQLGAYTGQPYELFPVQYPMSTFPGSESLVPVAPGTLPSGSYDPLAAWLSFDYVRAGYTDSAAAATTMSTGAKTFNNAIGVGMYGEALVHAAQVAKGTGRSTGVISTVEFSHATPAGFVAHNVSRNDYAGIANEMLRLSATDVIMGGGNPYFNDSGVPRTPTASQYNYVGGKATWDALVDGTLPVADCDGDGVSDPWTLIQDRSAFQALGAGATPKRVCGVFQAYTTTQQARAGIGSADPFVVPLTSTVPTLAEMTAGALNVLDNNPKGFFLMVEGGAIDWAAHANQKGRLIEEQMDFNEAVDTVLEWVRRNSNWGETMVIVTADHETGFLWGPGSGPPAVWNPLTNAGAGLTPGMQFNSGSHTNSLVPFFAKGDAARLFRPYATALDPVRGPYIDNTAIGRVLKTVLGK